MLKFAEIKDMSLGELKDQIKKSRLEFVTLRMKFASRQLDNPSEIKKKRKEITRLLTAETQKLKQEEKPKHHAKENIKR